MSCVIHNSCAIISSLQVTMLQLQLEVTKIKASSSCFVQEHTTIQPKYNVCCYSLGLQHVGTGKVTLPLAMRGLADDGKWYADNRHKEVPTEWIKRVLVAADLAEPDDEVVGVDCRDFHDPDRPKRDRENQNRPWGSAGRAASDDENHLGAHHTVMNGLVKHGANVWRPHLRRKENVPFGEWVSEFVLGPFWNAVVKIRAASLQASARSAGSAAPKKKVVVVFFCKWGRHRSVALQTGFLKAIPIVPWLSLQDATHLASHSWLWSTCNFCDV